MSLISVAMHIAGTEYLPWGDPPNSPAAASRVVITEDDALLCAGGLGRIAKQVQMAERVDKQWAVIRTGIGFIGIVFKASDLFAFRKFVKDW